MTTPSTPQALPAVEEAVTALQQARYTLAAIVKDLAFNRRGHSDEDRAIRRIDTALAALAAQPLAIVAIPEGWGKVLIDLVQPVENIDKNQPGYEHRMGWNQALQRVADIFSAVSQPPAGQQDRGESEIVKVLRQALEEVGVFRASVTKTTQRMP